MGKHTLTVKEFSGKFGIHEKTLYRYIKQGTVKGFKIGGKVLISVKEADKLLNQ